MSNSEDDLATMSKAKKPKKEIDVNADNVTTGNNDLQSTDVRESSKAMVQTAKQRLQAAPITTNKLLNGPVIILHLHNEHKYLHTLLAVLDEQLNALDNGLSPDYSIMIDVIDSIKNTLEHSHFPRKEPIYRKLRFIDKEYQDSIADIFEEQTELLTATVNLYKNLKRLINKETLDSIKNIKTDCESYLTNVQSYIDREENHLFPVISEVFTDAQWEDVGDEIQKNLKKKLQQRKDRRDQSIASYFSRRMSTATNNFTLYSFFSLSAFSEGLGAYASNSEVVHNVIKKNAKKVLEQERETHAALWKSRTYSPRKYMKASFDSILNMYDACIHSGEEIGEVLKNVKGELIEPYDTKMQLFNKMTYRKEADRRERDR